MFVNSSSLAFSAGISRILQASRYPDRYRDKETANLLEVTNILNQTEPTHNTNLSFFYYRIFLILCFHSHSHNFLVKGTHILINACSDTALRELNPFKEFILATIAKFNLISVGTVFHEFEGGGFTGVICLTESHLALHTWPEHNSYTCDIYLCDYSRENRQTAIDVSDAVKAYFKSYNIKEQIINR